MDSSTNILREKGLYGSGLVEVNTKVWVERYNNCLKKIGIKPTTLSQFTIDGMGWSPEIADEKDDNFYLSHGFGANQYGIILTPLQQNKPVYFPLHSYDKNLVNSIFQNAYNHIADVTLDTAIWFEIDQEIELYSDPADLLMLDSVMLNFHSVNGMIEAAHELKQLIKKFYDNQQHLWANEKARQQIRSIAKKHGDLRTRALDIQSLPYNNVQSFSTRAFGGVTVLRGLKNEKPVLVIENKEHIKPPRNQNYLLYHINYPSFTKFLTENKLVSIDLERFYIDEAARIKRILMFKFMQSYATFKKAEHSAIEVGNNNSLYRKYLNLMVQNKHFDLDFLALRKFSQAVENWQRIDESQIDPKILKYLYHPHFSLTDSVKDLVWDILSKIHPIDFAATYFYSKEVFYEKFASWPKQLQLWVADYLSKNIDNMNVD